MQIINTSNLNQARKQIQFAKKSKKQVIVKAQDETFNRKILENQDIDIFLSPELHDRKDYMKQRDSGLNEFLAKLAKKSNIKIGINLQEIQKLSPKEKSIILSRIKQNITICKRTNTKMIIMNREKFTKQDIISFFLTLGASTQQAKFAF
jgi:RNase P/RNase MRP subunit p30